MACPPRWRRDRGVALCAPGGWRRRAAEWRAPRHGARGRRRGEQCGRAVCDAGCHVCAGCRQPACRAHAGDRHLFARVDQRGSEQQCTYRGAFAVSMAVSCFMSLCLCSVDSRAACLVCRLWDWLLAAAPFLAASVVFPCTDVAVFVLGDVVSWLLSSGAFCCSVAPFPCFSAIWALS